MKTKLKYVGKLENNQASKDALEIIREYNKNITRGKLTNQLTKKFFNNHERFVACMEYFEILNFQITKPYALKEYINFLKKIHTIYNKVNNKKISIQQYPKKTGGFIDIPLEAFNYANHNINPKHPGPIFTALLQ